MKERWWEVGQGRGVNTLGGESGASVEEMRRSPPWLIAAGCCDWSLHLQDNVLFIPVIGWHRSVKHFPGVIDCAATDDAEKPVQVKSTCKLLTVGKSKQLWRIVVWKHSIFNLTDRPIVEINLAKIVWSWIVEDNKNKWHIP